MSMITSATWVPRGFAAPFPQKYAFDEAEFERIAELAKLQLDDAEDDLKEAQDAEGAKAAGASEKKENKTKEEIDINDDDLKEYDLEHYDDDDEEEDEDRPGQGESMGMFGNAKSLAYYESNKDDPYITLQDDDEDEDRDDMQILATDNLLLAAKIEDELAHLEVYVYEDAADNLYVHHDIMLPAIPLCVEWLDIPVQKQGVEKDATANFVAVGTMDPDIEVWDLDTIDCMNLLASASADKTVKLWDLHTTKCAKSYTYHTDKVCSLAWHTVEPTAPRWGVESDVENVRWDPHDQNYFYVSTENGIIHYHDVRNAPSNPAATKAVWTLQAHDESVSSFDINPVVPGFMVTGSTDKTVKLWNIQASGPSMVVSRNLDVGKIFATNFAPDPEVAFRLSVAGSKGTMHIWDTSTNAAVRHAFSERVAVPVKEGAVENRTVGVDSDDSEGSDDEEEGDNGAKADRSDDSMDED
ncbi:Deoxyhypusine synthase [Verticillium dahliae VDG1]|nr:Deoxyhypusine synthase [Verticillium dahliae VDG1]